MSWLSDNYEKAALGGAVIVTLALGAVVFKNKGELAEAFSLDTPKKNLETGVSSLSEMGGAYKSLGEVHEIRQPDVDGRKVDLFTGVHLFSKIDDQKNPVDLLKSPSVHKGIPNIWWLKYGIDPGFSDSPDRDPDKDGFTNHEEFDEGTHPMDFKSHPDPITKLEVVEVKTTQAHIKPSDFGVGKFMFKLQNRFEGAINKMPAQKGPIGAGENIVFDKAIMKNRFKFLRMFEVPIEKNGITQNQKRWEIEDLQPNKKDEKYLFDKRGKLIGDPDGKLGITDSTIELSLKALGEGGNPFKIEENNSFSLPYDEKATKKPYLLKKIDLKNLKVEVEYTDKDGSKKLHIMTYEKKKP